MAEERSFAHIDFQVFAVKLITIKRKKKKRKKQNKAESCEELF